MCDAYSRKGRTVFRRSNKNRYKSGRTNGRPSNYIIIVPLKNCFVICEDYYIPFTTRIFYFLNEKLTNYQYLHHLLLSHRSILFKDVSKCPEKSLCHRISISCLTLPLRAPLMDSGLFMAGPRRYDTPSHTRGGDQLRRSARQPIHHSPGLPVIYFESIFWRSVGGCIFSTRQPCSNQILCCYRRAADEMARKFHLVIDTDIPGCHFSNVFIPLGCANGISIRNPV